MHLKRTFIASAFLAALLLLSAGRLGAITIYAVDSTNNLLRFETATPGTIDATTPITGLEAGETIRGIDFRPSTAQLYALGSTSRLYVINTANGQATAVGSPGAFTLDGSSFGFDFNPVADRIRVVGVADQNLRLNPDTGALAATDDPLAYASGDPNQGANPTIAGAAYTNSYPGAASTTLYDIDSLLNILTTQNPPNLGTLNTEGSLGVNPNAVTFDIARIAGSDVGLATLRVGTTTTLYTIDLTSGTAVHAGNIGGNPQLVGMSVSLEPKTFVVTNRSDPGDGNCTAISCTLREAITAANENPGVDIISFNISGDGVRTITPATPLPELTSPVIIDGYTQPGTAPATADTAATIRIELNGSNAGAQGTGLRISVGQSIIRGLAINRFDANGISVIGENPASGGGNIIEGCHLGVDPGGTIARPNGNSGISLGTSANTVGGTIPAARNVISGNAGYGVAINNLTLNNRIVGNYIGTDATGTVNLGNAQHGINSIGLGLQIGGTEAGSGNVISGNGGSGVRILGAGTNIQKNHIGTNASGTADLGNSEGGVLIENASDTIIGGGKDGEGRNVISGNDGNGILIIGAGATGNRVSANFIGTDASGTVRLRNDRNGVGIQGAPDNFIGGTTAEARNVISGNNDSGVSISGTPARNNSVLGNYLGTDVSGTVRLGNSQNGVAIYNAPANFVGGTAAGAGNLISANGIGIQIGSANAAGGAPDNIVQGNRIGTDASGTANLGNNIGILLFTDSGDTTIGGPAGAGNIVAFSKFTGVAVNAASSGNSIIGNSMFANEGLGIDLQSPDDGPTVVTANDFPDSDSGANNLQNYPTLTGITVAGESKSVEGELASNPNTNYVVDFYRSSAVDPSGFGEGETYLGFINVRTNAQGRVNFTFPLDANADGQYITATATDAAGNTSEFSQASEIVPGVPPEPTPSPTAAPTPAPLLANISTRLRVETGNNVLIGGFIVTGSVQKRLMVRAIGPSLGIEGALADPTLEIYNSGGEIIATNDNWRESANQQEIIDSTIPPSDDREAAFLAPLDPGAYTAVVSGVNGTTGIGLVEVYDLDQQADARLANIATRGFVQTGDDVLIGGLIITGSSELNVLLRAIGPSLNVADKLADPTVELFNANGDALAFNNNWRDTQQSEIIATTIPPADELEAAIVTTLAPANYTAVVRGVNDSTGIALVEVYALP